jgi:histone-lysine N-methyltransferase SETMAR
VSYSKLLLLELIEQKASRFHRIIIVDDSWFDFYFPRGSAGPSLRDELPQRIMQKIDVGKCLVSILLLVDRTHSFLDVLKGTTYNITFFTDAIVSSSIENARSRTRRKTMKCWLIHMDNGHPHNSRRAQRCVRASGAESLPHPAYSPDLAPDDFFLFR